MEDLRIVLIPSSSGLHFKLRPVRLEILVDHGLNPFFVRSSFQTEHHPSTNHIGTGLNPFFVRSSFQTIEWIASTDGVSS